MSDTNIYGESRYGEAYYGGSDATGASTATGVPWRFNRVRVEGIEGSVPAVVPGESVSYRVIIHHVDGATDHIERYQVLRSYLPTAPHVVTYQTASGTYFRDQAPGGGTQLVRIEPIHPSAAPGRNAGEPAPRESAFDGRWAVITGGTDETTLPEEVCILEIETTTIASTDDFPTEQGLRDARERSGL